MSETFPPDLIAFVRAEKDRREIWDCLLRYARGLDRLDKAMMVSAYHLDARDEHGVFKAHADGFCDWAIGWHGAAQLRHQHILTNHSVDLDGDHAHGETYYTFWGENRQGPPTLAFGRYIDRFEKRDGLWGIAHRVCINEYAGAFTPVEIPAEWLAAMKSTGPDRRDRNDLSYDRPLRCSRTAKPQ